MVNGSDIHCLGCRRGRIRRWTVGRDYTRAITDNWFCANQEDAAASGQSQKRFTDSELRIDLAKDAALCQGPLRDPMPSSAVTHHSLAQSVIFALLLSSTTCKSMAQPTPSA